MHVLFSGHCNDWYPGNGHRSGTLWLVRVHSLTQEQGRCSYLTIGTFFFAFFLLLHNRENKEFDNDAVLNKIRQMYKQIHPPANNMDKKHCITDSGNYSVGCMDWYGT